MAIKFTKLCGSLTSRTKLDFGRVAKKVTKIHHPGCCAGLAKRSSDGSSKAKDLAALSCQSINSTKTNSSDTVFHQHHLPERKYLHNRLECLLILNAALTLSSCLCE